MLPEALTVIPEQRVERLPFRVAWLCSAALFLEGYDIVAVGYAIPSLVDAWQVRPQVFTAALTCGNVGLLLGSLSAGLLGDRLGRKPVLIGCVTVFGIFSLLSALVGSPVQLAGLQFLTGLGLGGGIPLATTLALDFAPPTRRGRFLILICTGVAIGFAVGGLLASQLVRVFGWPAIFVVGGVLPLAMTVVLALWLPESVAPRAATQPHHAVAALFESGLALRTVLLWPINVLNLLGIYFILQWTPAILHSAGMSPSRAILGTSMYSLGVITCSLLTASIVDRMGMERVLTCGLALGALCVLSIGLFHPRLFWVLSLIIFGAGIGGGCQGGIIALSSLMYPPAIRSTGAGWALGAGRIGTIAGPLLGGVLLALGIRAQDIFLAASIPAFGVTVLMAILGRLRQRTSSTLVEFHR
jgi:AAHS family 4-hydroxybenzoate transporter-like MFS transporter